MGSKHYDAIFNRHSIRCFKSSLTLAMKQELQDFADKRYEQGMGDYGLRIAICSNGKAFQRRGKNGIVGTDTFAALISKKTDDLFVGYFGESFVLECVSRGIGTCWLGLSYKKKAVESSFSLDDDEEIVCIIALGIPTGDFVQSERKTTTALTDYTVEEFRELPKWQKLAIECARLAPSSLNVQPWKFYIYSDAISLKNIRTNHGYELIDCGTAMLHLELGARAAGVDIHWDIDAEDEFILVLDDKDEYSVKPISDDDDSDAEVIEEDNYEDAESYSDFDEDNEKDELFTDLDNFEFNEYSESDYESYDAWE